MDKAIISNQEIFGNVTIISKKPSKSKPNIGSMITKSEVYNENKELIMTLESISIVRKRNEK